MIGRRYEHTLLSFILWSKVRHGLQHQLGSNHFCQKSYRVRSPLLGSWRYETLMSFVVALQGSARQTEVKKCLSWQAGTSGSQYFFQIYYTYVSPSTRRRRFDKWKAESIRLIQKKKSLLVHTSVQNYRWWMIQLDMYDKNRNSYAISDSSKIYLVVCMSHTYARTLVSLSEMLLTALELIYNSLQIFHAIHGSQIEWVDVPCLTQPSLLKVILLS